MSKLKSISILINGKKQVTLSIAIVLMIFSATLGAGRWYLNNTLSALSQKIQLFVHQDIQQVRDKLLQDNLLIKENLATLNTMIKI